MLLVAGEKLEKLSLFWLQLCLVDGPGRALTSLRQAGQLGKLARPGRPARLASWNRGATSGVQLPQTEFQWAGIWCEIK